jgi:hypothetical protein
MHIYYKFQHQSKLFPWLCSLMPSSSTLRPVLQEIKHLEKPKTPRSSLFKLGAPKWILFLEFLYPQYGMRILAILM